MPEGGIRGHLAAKLGIAPKAPPLTDLQLTDFANYGGEAGVGSTLQNLNKRLLQLGAIDKNTDVTTSLGAPIASEGFKVNKGANSIIPTMAADALMRAKKLGITNADEFMANAGNIFTNPLHKQLLADKAFNQMYPNMLQTIARLYVNRNNEYKPQQ